MVEELHRHFPTLFDQDDTGGEEGEDSAGAGGEAEGRGGNPFVAYGITPYVLTYCRVTLTPIAEVYKSSVIHLFYIVSYETMRKRRENEELKKYRKGYV